MNRVLLFKKFAGKLSKLGLGKSQTMVKVYEEILSYLGSRIRADFIEIEGQRLFLDKEDSLMLSIKNKEHENFETECAKNIINEGDVVVDLGANIGYYTLIFAKLVGKNGEVFAFEPEPNNFELLKKNVEFNLHKNVTLIQKAVSDKNGIVKMYVSKRNLASHRIFDAGDNRKTINVDTITLDEFFKDYPRQINFIKMDVEGVEGGVILGASNLLEKSKKISIMTEYFPKLIEKFGMNPEDIIKLLIDKDFKIYHIDNIRKKLNQVDLDYITSNFSVQKKNYANFLCIKGNESKIKF